MDAGESEDAPAVMEAGNRMEPHVIELLAEMQRQGLEHDARETDHSRKMLNLEPGTAQLVSILARSSGATSILEIGTSSGYSTIWLASAVTAGAGRVVTIDHSAEKQAMARENLRRAGLLDRVEMRLGKAGTILPELKGPFDLVFIDADRKNAPENLKILLPKLAPRVFLLADNTLSHAEELAEYLATVSKLDGFDHVIVPIGKGLSVAYRGPR
ncbi:MAG TPA: class I SAM-dependent methyltransferase [Candidatus Acidoferrales bacterium]|nr:class I SAM-dependent methyltransferase [Candidatus Acidoferrales bacterium]